jgi:hypothetical protein
LLYVVGTSGSAVQVVSNAECRSSRRLMQTCFLPTISNTPPFHALSWFIMRACLEQIGWGLRERAQSLSRHEGIHLPCTFLELGA